MTVSLYRLATAFILLFVLHSSAIEARDLRLATTTSTDNSGLLRAILPQFERQRGIKVHVISVGTGKALKLAENGDVDVVLVHDREAEEAFVAAGHGSERRDVMYNDFVLVGPKSDPAGVRGGDDVLAALRKIAATQARFVSRGDDSGTERMEQSYWRALDITAQGKAMAHIGGSRHGRSADHGWRNAGLYAVRSRHLRQLSGKDGAGNPGTR
jgi:tungstate transport system substrate-binding protein